MASFRVQSIEDADILLVLNITAVKGGIFRIQIEEPDSTRYRIEHVLDGEPEIVKLVDINCVKLSLVTIFVVLMMFH